MSKTNKPKFGDPRLKDFVRKPWREFIRIGDKDHCTAIARFYLGSMGATHEDFAAATGINLLNYPGCYMEAGAALGPTGPVLPGPIKSILAFKQTGSGRWNPEKLDLPGLYHQSMVHAWVKTDIWEKAIGDEDYFEEVFLAGKDIDKKALRKKNAKSKKEK